MPSVSVQEESTLNDLPAVPPAFEPPTLAGSVTAKYAGTCRLCGRDWQQGERIWIGPTGHKWFCTQCRWRETRQLPTWGALRTKIHHRAGQGLPPNLDSLDLQILAWKLEERGGLVPARLGEQSNWSQRLDREYAEGNFTVDRVRSLEEAYGLVLDALEHGFSANLSKKWALELEAYASGGRGPLP